MTAALSVRHGGGSYPVLIEPGLLQRLGSIAAELLPGRRLVVITDRTVGRVVSHNLEAPTLVVSVGESSKSRARWSALTDRLLDLGYGRDGAVVALGGGVIGDLAGFVAATYMRGIPWLQVPTSLVAMVDASVGGKTGVNTSHGKNQVGAFHPPAGVVVDPRALGSLHPEHLGAGLVEALKHGLVADAGYFHWIEAHAAALLGRDPGLLAELITKSIAIKAEIVAADERELGRRAILNAGHTVGHSIEQVSDFSILHGNAVGIGLVVEALLAHRLGLAERALAPTIRLALEKLERPTLMDPGWSDGALLEAMHHDKKVREDTLRFALPEGIGRMAGADSNWTVAATDEVVGEVLMTARSTATLY